MTAKPLIIEQTDDSPLTKVKVNASDAIALEASDDLQSLGTLHKTPRQEPLDLEFDPLSSLTDNLLGLWTRASSALRHGYLTTTGSLIDELLIRGSEKQLNDALHTYVTQNVEMVHRLHLTLHDNWLRLYATVYTSGVFASVACNFRLVTIEINSDYQRLVFEQLSDTEILTLHSKKWHIATAAKLGVGLYRLLLRKDPLAFALSKITVKSEPFAVHKGKYIYLDISRYFVNKPDITKYFKKVHVNDAYTTPGNLLAKVQINFAELINFGVDGDDIISEQDDPAQYAKKQQKQRQKEAELQAQIAKKRAELAANAHARQDSGELQRHPK